MNESQKNRYEKYKVVAFVTLVIFAICAGFSSYIIWQGQHQIAEEISANEKKIQAIVSIVGENSATKYKRRIKSLLNIKTAPVKEEILKAFERQDREELLKLSEPYFKAFKEENPHFKTFAWALPNNRMFLRVPKPEFFDDDISVPRPDIVRANKDLQQNYGYMTGYSGLSFRVVQPVVYKGRHLGVVQFGLSEFFLVDTLDRQLEDVLIYQVLPAKTFQKVKLSTLPSYNDGSFTVQSHEHNIDLLKSASTTIDWTLDQQRTVIQGKDYVISKVSDLSNYDGKPEGWLFALTDISELTSEMRTDIIIIISLSIILLLLSSFVISKSYNKLIYKITQQNIRLEEKVVERTRELTKLHQRIEFILGATNTGLDIIDSDFNIRYIDPEWAKRYDPINGRKCHQYFADLTEPCSCCGIVKAMETKKIVVAEETLPKEGNRPIQVTTIPFQNEEGEWLFAEVKVDITERKRAEEALRESEKRFRTLFDGMSDGVAIYEAIDAGADFVFVDYNRAGRKMDNLPWADAVGRRLTEVFPGVEEFGLLAVLKRVWETGVAEQLPTSIYKDGRVSYWRNNKVYRLPSGEVAAIYSDETAAKKAEEALRPKHARFAAVMNSLDAVVYVADMETYEVLFINQYTRDLFGDVVGKVCWQSIQTGQTGPCAFCTNDKLLDADGNPTGTYVWEFQNTRNHRWYQCRDNAIPWPDGRIVRIETAVDITDRKQVEEATERRGRYLAGLNNATQSLLAADDAVPFQEFVDKIGPASDAGRTYVFMNHRDAGGGLLMSQKAEWCAEGIQPEIDNPLLQDLSYDVWLPRWRESLSSGSLVSGRVADFPEKERDVLEPQEIKAILIIPIMVDREFVGFIGFDNCVSEREWDGVGQTFLRSAANNLAQAIRSSRSEQNLRASIDEKVVLLREIHHRVKNNMQVILSLLRMHARRSHSEQIQTVFDDCRDRVNAMSLIHEALYQSDDLARIDLEAYLAKLCRNLSAAHNASGKGIAVTVAQCNMTLDMDKCVAVGMVIAELVSNAFKHAFPSGKGGQVSVILSCLDEEEVELIVQDNGKGLPEEIDILNSPSVGLRLAVAAVTRELGGLIEVERNGGTRFIIRFMGKSA